MIINIITKATAKSKKTVETIACFDDCLFCGGLRTKRPGGFIVKKNKKGEIIEKKEVQIVYCCCDTPEHIFLDQEWIIIDMLDDYGIKLNINLEK